MCPAVSIVDELFKVPDVAKLRIGDKYLVDAVSLTTTISTQQETKKMVVDVVTSEKLASLGSSGSSDGCILQRVSLMNIGLSNFIPVKVAALLGSCLADCHSSTATFQARTICCCVNVNHLDVGLYFLPPPPMS